MPVNRSYLSPSSSIDWLRRRACGTGIFLSSPKIRDRSVHFRGRLGGPDPGNLLRGQSRAALPCWCVRILPSSRLPTSRASASAPAAGPSVISWCLPPWKTPIWPRVM